MFRQKERGVIMLNAKSAREMSNKVIEDRTNVKLEKVIEQFKAEAEKGFTRTKCESLYDNHLREAVEKAGFDIEEGYFVSWLYPKKEKAEEVKKIFDSVIDTLVEKELASIEEAIRRAIKNGYERIDYLNSELAIKPVLRKKVANALIDNEFVIKSRNCNKDGFIIEW